MMKFPKVKIWKAASKEELTGNPMRNAICHIKYDAEDNVLIAIDGFIMAVAEVEGNLGCPNCHLVVKADIPPRSIVEKARWWLWQLRQKVKES